MKWWIQHAIIGTTLAACVQQDATQIETTEQTTCPGPGNFQKIDPLKALKFDGKLPALTAGQSLVTTPDPNVKDQSLVVVVDTQAGTVPYAATFATKDLGLIHGAGPNQPWLDIIRIPPVPPPIGTKWFTAYLLETTLVLQGGPDVGASNVWKGIKIAE